MKYDVAAIPTKYNGVKYRSRLEARWAAFFELLKWSFEYEPLDFNGWIPDFAIKTTDGWIYCELKPIDVIDFDVVRKMEQSGAPGELVILSRAPFASSVNSTEGRSIGWLGELIEDDRFRSFIISCEGGRMRCVSESRTWDEATLRPGPNRDELGFCHGMNSYQDRISGYHDGHPTLDKYERRWIDLAWREAGNVTQWKRS